MQQIRPGQGVTPSDTLMKIFQENVRKLNTVQFKAHAMLTMVLSIVILLFVFRV